MARADLTSFSGGIWPDLSFMGDFIIVAYSLGFVSLMLRPGWLTMVSVE